MKTNYRKVRVFIASPNDVEEERNRVVNIISEFNQTGSSIESIGLVVEGLDWRTHVSPMMGRPEGVVLDQLPVDSWDLFVGIMWKKFGSPTGGVDPATSLTYDSGTHEEFKLAHELLRTRGAPQILFYRCRRLIDPTTIDIDQLKRVNNFFSDFAPGGKHPGIYSGYITPDEFERKARQDLEKTIRKLAAGGTKPGRALKGKRSRTAAARTDDKIQKGLYLEHIIASNKYLPVAGFETNLRIPIPLDRVYVHLQARMSEIQRAQHGPMARSATQTAQDRTVSAQDALNFAIDRKYDGLAILGHPGSGKTTLAKYLALCFATATAGQNLGIGKPLLPLLIPLRSVDPGKNLIQNILALLEEYSIDVDEKFFRRYLRGGKAIVLLDGLDEVPTEKKRSLVSRWIHHNVHLAFPKSPVVITSRFSGYRGDAVLPGAYLRLEIQDYDLPQIKQFVENWLTAVETHLHEDTEHWRTQARLAGTELCRRIESTPALKELAVNPLMLQIIALVHRDRGMLPDRRVELYKECTDVLLERWDKAKGLEVLLSAVDARRLLQPVALWMHSVQNRREVSEKEIYDFIRPHLSRIKKKVNAQDLMKSWQERSGIFKGEGDMFFFNHLSFQEYLTAEEVRNKKAIPVLVKYFDDAWWREPTLLAMGLTNPSIFTEFMSAVLNLSGSNGGGTDFMLRCIDEATEKEEEAFLKAMRSAKNFTARYRALLGLERIATEEARAGVRSALSDKDERIVEQARGILAGLGEAPAEKEVERSSVTIEGKAIQLPKRIFNPVEQNAEYILIPGGSYKYSVAKRQTEIPPLYVARNPVTNKQYRRFIRYLQGEKVGAEPDKITLNAFADRLISHSKKIKDMSRYIGADPSEWAGKLRSRYDDGNRFNGDDQPVVGITWYAAASYCHWLTDLTGKMNPAEKVLFRLPDEKEWEWAASGGNRVYPWGDNKPDEKRANYGGMVGQTTPVGAFPAGATPEGLMDMAGNVWEWMENRYEKGSPYCALRGGSWFLTTEYLRCTSRVNYGYPDDWNDFIGFRVVRLPVREAVSSI